MATTQSAFGMAHYTVVPENFDSERPDRRDDGDGSEEREQDSTV